MLRHVRACFANASHKRRQQRRKSFNLSDTEHIEVSLTAQSFVLIKVSRDQFICPIKYFNVSFSNISRIYYINCCTSTCVCGTSASASQVSPFESIDHHGLGRVDLESARGPLIIAPPDNEGIIRATSCDQFPTPARRLGLS